MNFLREHGPALCITLSLACLVVANALHHWRER